MSVAYVALVPRQALRPSADAAEARWHPASNGPALAFDHDRIVADARRRLAARVRAEPLALALLPARFTLSELQAVHEAAEGGPLDTRNFRRWVRSAGLASHNQRNGTVR